MRYATDAAHCGHFSAQLMQPLMQPECWSEFVQESCDDPKYPVPLDLNPQVLSAPRVGAHTVGVVESKVVTDTMSDRGDEVDGIPNVEGVQEDLISDDDYFIFT